MKAFFIVILAAVLLAAQTSRAEPQQVLALVQDLKTQQTQIAENQMKMEVKIADLAETIRVARIHTSRLGGHKLPAPPAK